MARSTFTTMVVGGICLLFAGPMACAKGFGWNAFPATSGDESEGVGGSGGDGGSGGATESTTTTSTTTATESTTSSSTFTTTTTSTNTSSGGCDGAVTCDSCANCSLNGTCAAAANGCFNDQDCNALLDCLQACVDDTCANACADAHPSGMNLYMDMAVCVYCQGCYVDCDGASTGACQ